MEHIPKKDFLSLNKDVFIKSILSPGGKAEPSSIIKTPFSEEIYLSCTLHKYNKYGFRQDRTLLITN